MFLKEMFVAMYYAINAKLADMALGKLNLKIHFLDNFYPFINVR